MGKKQAISHPDQNAELRRELGKTAQALRSAHDKFNYVCEPEMVDACIYEINALQSRYSYLLRCIKGMEPMAKVPDAQVAVDDREPPCTAASRLEGGTLCHS